MKKLTIFIITLATAAIILPGCKKSYFDINDNPNSSTNATADLVLANALKTQAAFQNTSFSLLSEWMCYWAPSGSFAMSAQDGASYFLDDLSSDAIWTNYYRNLADYNYVEQKATIDNQYYYIAAAKTMKALGFSQLVDMFNNVPYSEALQGTAKLTPKYDKGQDIYESLNLELKEAVTLFQRADAAGSTIQDILFHGDRFKWAQFANTLRLRLLMRQTQMPGRFAYIKAQVDDIIGNGSGFLTANAGVNPGYSNSAGKQNPFWGFNISVAGAYTQAFWRAAKYSIDFCITNNDPRYTRLYAPLPPPAAPNTYVGTVQGSGSNPPISSVFGPGTLVSASQDAVIFTAAESYLLQAEAITRGIMTGSAQAMFNTGVQASFTFLGAGSSAAYTSQGGNKETNYGACNTEAERIACVIRQQWMAHNSVTPFEAWCDYRRLGLPPVPITVSPFAAQYIIPKRFLYVRSETQTNNGNVVAQGAIDRFTSKIFWMP